MTLQAWDMGEMKRLVDLAEATLREAIERFGIKARLIRKVRVWGG